MERARLAGWSSAPRILIAAVASLLGAGCPGALEAPGRFFDGGTQGGGNALGGDCPEGTDVEADLLATRCAGSACHSPEAPAGGLDLVSPGVSARLVEVASSPSCGGAMLVAPGDPGASLLFQKLGESPPCGARMPLGGSPLPDDELACVSGWIEGMAAAAEGP